MHVGVIAAPTRESEARNILRALREIAIEATGSTVADHWTRHEGEPLRWAIAAATHLLLLLPDGPPADWAYYLLGYAAGRDLPASVLGPAALPAAFNGAVVLDAGQVADYFMSERSLWERARRVQDARARLRGRDRDTSAFYEAANQADIQRVDDYLTVGVSADARTSAGAPVLVGAVRGRSEVVVQRLLAQGADPNATCGDDGTNPLCEAASGGLGTIVGVLLAHGADPNQLTGSGQTALMLAASQGHASVVEHLLAAGADASVVDSLGMRAADYARLFGRVDITAALERGGDC